ncbi:hypothetical protein [Candidatus Ichthyocystis sparus]|uniref:hypothetical protein n=1 Tax=Candidatus Ichthyocystis sparus TaxID=1561004 RepID=UPI000B84BAEC|nr:hypothetical protein [Candidatus Ichthyocystis sparus]
MEAPLPAIVPSVIAISSSFDEDLEEGETVEYVVRVSEELENRRKLREKRMIAREKREEAAREKREEAARAESKEDKLGREL